MMYDRTTNSKHRSLVKSVSFLLLILGQKTPYIRSMVIAELDANTKEASVDIEAESTNIKMMPNTAPGRVWVRTLGISTSELIAL